MAEAFDAYHKWLGIPPKDQPPNHYRLLGIDLFEPDSDAIAHAADQRMVYIRSLQSSHHVDLSQKILDEISAARVCLLDADRKLQYDQRLREQFQVKPRLPRSILPQQVRQEAKQTMGFVSGEGVSSRLTQCRYCHRRVSKRADLCPHCGADKPAPLVCVDCDATLGEHAETCPNCGAPNPNYLVPAVVVREPDIIDLAMDEVVDKETEKGTIRPTSESVGWGESIGTTNSEQAEVSGRAVAREALGIGDRASRPQAVAGTIGKLLGWVGAIDNALRAVAGEENTILHNFLRCLVAFVPVAILGALIWMALL